MTLALVLAAALSPVLGYVPERQGSDPLADPVLEARVQKLGKQLRCAVCQGVAISDSPASMARAQLDKVRELVAAGKSDQEVLDYFVARYGEWVLLEPTKGGLNAVLWVTPAAIVVIGVLLIVWQSRRKGLAPAEPAKQEPAASPAAAPAAEDDFVARVRADLEK